MYLCQQLRFRDIFILFLKRNRLRSVRPALTSLIYPIQSLFLHSVYASQNRPMLKTSQSPYFQTYKKHHHKRNAFAR